MGPGFYGWLDAVKHKPTTPNVVKIIDMVFQKLNVSLNTK